jgi:hypothetical protein
MSCILIRYTYDKNLEMNQPLVKESYVVLFVISVLATPVLSHQNTSIQENFQRTGRKMPAGCWLKHNMSCVKSSACVCTQKCSYHCPALNLNLWSSIFSCSSLTDGEAFPIYWTIAPTLTYKIQNKMNLGLKLGVLPSWRVVFLLAEFNSTVFVSHTLTQRIQQAKPMHRVTVESPDLTDLTPHQK